MAKSDTFAPLKIQVYEKKFTVDMFFVVSGRFWAAGARDYVFFAGGRGYRPEG